VKRWSPLLLSLILCAATAPIVSAHEYWLQPSTYRAAAHDTLLIAAFAGTGFRGERKPYPAPRTVRLTLVGPKSIDLRPGATNGDLIFSRFIVADGGGAMVAYESSFTPIELPAEEFDRYLKLEGLDEPLAARARLGAAAGAGRERYGRCAKTWITGTDPQRATTPVGLSMELVPLGDPTRTGPLAVRVLFHGQPLAHALVRAWRQPLEHSGLPAPAASRDSVGASTEARSGGDGVARLRLTGSGEWMVSTVHMVPSEDRSIADWQSLWASLTFAR
jgi:uncharacterized GH25 family protein